MSADLAAFVRAMRDRPDDDTVRLVCADWFEENGEADRAAFVRLGVAKAATGLTMCPKGTRVGRPWGCGSCDFCRLEIACERFHEDPDLWRAVVGDSLDRLPGYAHTSRHPSRFAHEAPSEFPTVYTARGFVDEMSLPAPLWLAHGDALLAAHPVRKVRPTTPLGGFEGDGERWRLDGDPAARTFTATEVSRASRLHDTLAMSLYRCRWPGVEFEFPPEERRRWAYEDSRVRDAVSFRAAWEAGRRAAMERDERVLRAILGGTEENP